MHHGYVTPRTLRGIFWLRFVTAYLVGMAVTSSLVAAFRNCYGPLVWKACSAKCTWTSFSRTDLDGSTFFHCLTRCTTRSSRLGCWLRMNLLCTRPHLSRTSTIQIPLLSTNCLCSCGDGNRPAELPSEQCPGATSCGSERPLRVGHCASASAVNRNFPRPVASSRAKIPEPSRVLTASSRRHRTVCHRGRIGRPGKAKGHSNGEAHAHPLSRHRRQGREGQLLAQNRRDGSIKMATASASTSRFSRPKPEGSHSGG
jgi:hypothetical protein